MPVRESLEAHSEQLPNPDDVVAATDLVAEQRKARQIMVTLYLEQHVDRRFGRPCQFVGLMEELYS